MELPINQGEDWIGDLCRRWWFTWGGGLDQGREEGETRLEKKLGHRKQEPTLILKPVSRRRWALKTGGWQSSFSPAFSWGFRLSEWQLLVPRQRNWSELCFCVSLTPFYSQFPPLNFPCACKSCFSSCTRLVAVGHPLDGPKKWVLFFAIHAQTYICVLACSYAYWSIFIAGRN